jgi:hypothetical protein
MHPTARLAGFAATLALVGGGAAALGSATDASPPFQNCLTAEPGGEAMAGEHGGAAMAEAVDGADGTRGTLEDVTLRPGNRAFAAGQKSTWNFTVTDCDGNAITEFERDQTKLLHLIVARTDLTAYQHLHPTLGADGRFSVDIDFAQPGEYRAIADFTTGGRRFVLGTTLRAAGQVTPAPLPAASTTASIDGYDVVLRRPAVLTAGEESELTFEVSRDGKPVTALEPYLGARGHLVALHAGDLAYSHVHPSGESLSTGTIAFDAELHEAGPYRLFLQFQVDGHVHTAGFTQEATR